MIVYLSLIAVRAPTPPEATAIAIAGMALGPRTPTAATDVTVPAKKQASPAAGVAAAVTVGVAEIRDAATANEAAHTAQDTIPVALTHIM